MESNNSFFIKPSGFSDLSPFFKSCHPVTSESDTNDHCFLGYPNIPGSTCRVYLNLTSLRGSIYWGLTIQ